MKTNRSLQKLRFFAALFSYALGYLYIQSFWVVAYNGLGMLWFVLCFFAFGEVLAHLCARGLKMPQILYKPSKEAVFFFVCTLGIALAIQVHLRVMFKSSAFLAWNNSRGMVLGSYGLFALHGFAAYWVLCRFGWLTKGKTSAYLPLDALNALLLFPFGNFFLRIKSLYGGFAAAYRAKFREKFDKKPIARTALLVGVFVAFFAVALSLLRGSDDGFAALVQAFTFSFSFSWDFGDFVGYFFLSLPVGAYLFGLVGGCMAKKQVPTALECEVETCIAKSAQWRILSPAVLAALLGGFVLLYALYFGVQLEYFLGAFWGELPAHFTFSEYARKGYFELCQLMTLNFTVLALAAKCSTVPLRKTKALKTAAVVLLISSLLFAATAFAKLGLYISAYGITELRMLSCWGVSVLCVAVALALASIHRARPVFAKLMYVACASFTVLCFLCV